MSYTKKELEIHTHLSELYENYRDNDFIQFELALEVSGSQHLETIIRAILAKEVLNIYYQPFYEDKPYFIDVHPYILKEYKLRWYLLGLNEFKGQLRTYALDRIRDIRASQGIRFIEKEFSARDYFKNSIGIIAPTGKPPLVKIAVQKTQAQYLISRPWHHSQNLVEENDEEIIFSFRLHPTYEFKSLVLGLGTDAFVLEPAQLRIELLKDFRELAARYEQPVESRRAHSP